jgi:hypothetical protein
LSLWLVQEADWPRGHGGGGGSSRTGAASGSIRREPRDEFAILNRTEKSFAKAKNDDTTEIGKVSKTVKFILNRLGPANFDKLSDELVGLEIKSKDILERVCWRDLAVAACRRVPSY